MSHTDEQLLIIYEAEAEQWATYLHSVFTDTIPDNGIRCYDITMASSQPDDFLQLARYTCKLLILSKGMLEDLCQLRRFFLARVLRPAARVVVLLCGVETLTPLTDLVPLNADECLQISSEQEIHEYLSAVTDIVRKGVSAAAANVAPLGGTSSRLAQKVEQPQPAGSRRSNAVIVPSRVPCESSMEVFILLRNEVAGDEVEFSDGNRTLRVKPVRWNDLTLCLNAPDFPAGNVSVTIYSDGVPRSKAQMQYYSNVEEVACLLSRAADPAGFMLQALQVPSAEMLDHKLSSMLLERMPTGGFRGLQREKTPEGAERHHADVPSLLHFAARYGFKSVSSLLLQCPGAERALRTANRRGQTPTEIAKRHGHAELRDLLEETLNKFTSGEDNHDASVCKTMCTTGNPSAANARPEQQGDDGLDEEDPYAVLGLNDDGDTVATSKNMVLLANRPPAPNPRPGCTHVKDQTPYIIQVFQKKKTPQGDANNLYSLPTKQACRNEDSISSTYDTFSPHQTHVLQGCAELQQKVKAGSLTADKAIEGVSDFQRVHKDTEATHRETPSQLGSRIINHKDDSGVTGNKPRRGSQAVALHGRSLKGQPCKFFRKADKR